MKRISNSGKLVVWSGSQIASNTDKDVLPPTGQEKNQENDGRDGAEQRREHD
jgi:hypothetical protein